MDFSLSDMQKIVDQNNSAMKENAQAVNEFNSQEAQKNRDWQTQMSNTAHQREVEDLKKAGLNPILSANGSGASTPSGSTATGSKADVDTQMAGILANLAITASNNATALQVGSMNASAMQYSAFMANDASKYASDKNWDISLTKPGAGAWYSANTGALGLVNAVGGSSATTGKPGNAYSIGQKVGNLITGGLDKIYSWFSKKK